MGIPPTDLLSLLACFVAGFGIVLQLQHAYKDIESRTEDLPEDIEASFILHFTAFYCILLYLVYLLYFTAFYCILLKIMIRATLPKSPCS